MGLTIGQSCDSVRINEGTMAPCAQTTCCENKEVSACGFIIALHYGKVKKRIQFFTCAGALWTAEDQHAISALMPHLFRSAPCKCFQLRCEVVWSDTDRTVAHFFNHFLRVSNCCCCCRFRTVVNGAWLLLRWSKFYACWVESANRPEHDVYATFLEVKNKRCFTLSQKQKYS